MIDSSDPLGPIEIAIGGEALVCAIGVMFGDPADSITDAAIVTTSSYDKLVVSNVRKSTAEVVIAGETFGIGEAVIFNLTALSNATAGTYYIYFAPTLTIAGLKPSKKAVKIVRKHIAR